MDRILSIDLETYSDVDIKSCGMYKYVQSPHFEILLFAYAYDDEPVQIIDLAQGETIPPSIIADLNNPDIKKHAFNAAFEYNSLSKFFETTVDQWHCTMVHALYCGYPGSLDAVGKAMKFSQEKKKMAEGKALIKYFCTPCKPTKANGNRTRNLPKHDPAKWELFKEYCRQDVVTEREVNYQLSPYPVPQSEHELWVLDQKINSGGVLIDTDLVKGAITVDAHMQAELTQQAIGLTGLSNPNSVAQLKFWVEQQCGRQIDSLNKETIPELLSDDTLPDNVRSMLGIRKIAAKTSVKKYTAMDSAICMDGRVRGLLQFYGANRTGRWAGRLVQVQNLPRNYIESLDTARDLVKKQKVDALKLIYGNVPDTLSQLIRTAFVPGNGCYFAVADFSAIEARVIAWLAGEKWRLDVFNTHGKIYEASASSMFGVPIERIKKGNEEYALRGKGKVAELALGYQGGKNALITMGALNMGLSEDELPDIVRRWRTANRRICDFWYSVEKAAVTCVREGTSVALDKGIVFTRDTRCLMITLPSGRTLHYINPVLRENDWGSEQVWFKGLNQTNKQWELTPTYGGKLVENIVQAVARDCLANTIVNLDKEGYKINFHIHDEVILEVPLEDKAKGLEHAIEVMCRLPVWAEGLPLNADGFTGTYYKKE